MTGFEGSYGGHAGRISDQAVMECKICWNVYDPAVGDPFRQIDPGTAFANLPDDWSCPTCSADPHQFMVLRDPGAARHLEALRIREATEELVIDFTEVWHSRMRDVPLVNKEVVDFPSGACEFLHNTREMTGPCKARSLFSPMVQFTRQQDSVDVANAVMAAIFDPAHRAETDRRADIRTRREAALAPMEPDIEPADSVPSRRAVITSRPAVGQG